MTRSNFSRNLSWLSAVALLVAVTAGCNGLVLTAAYLIKGNTEDPEFDGLKKKTVAIVCRPSSSLKTMDPAAANDLADRVQEYMKINGSKIKLIDQQKVREYLDEEDHADAESAEIGKALKADMVVSIDLEMFKYIVSPTLYQGRSDVSIRVYDCKTGKIAYRKSLPDLPFPNHAQPSEGRPEQFRATYIEILSKRIGECFCEHESHSEIGRNNEAYNF